MEKYIWARIPVPTLPSSHLYLERFQSSVAEDFLSTKVQKKYLDSGDMGILVLVWVQKKAFCLESESNTRPSDLQSDALPTELSRHLLVEKGCVVKIHKTIIMNTKFI